MNMDIRKIIREESDDFGWVSDELKQKPSPEVFLSMDIPVKMEDYIAGFFEQTFIILMYADGSVDEILVDDGPTILRFESFSDYSNEVGDNWTTREGFLDQYDSSRKLEDINKEFYDVLMTMFSPKEIWINDL